jgi:hypothetical protein
VEFKKDWNLMQSILSNRASAVAKASTPQAGGSDVAFLSNE